MFDRLTVSFMLVFLLLCIAINAAEPTPVTSTQPAKGNEMDVLAEYDGGVILRKDIEAKIAKLPPTYQPRYRTVDGQIEVLNITATEEAFYMKALKMGVDKDPTVLERIKSTEKRFLIQEYYKRKVTDLVVLTDDELHKYYNDNLSSFYLNPYITIEHIQVKDEAEGKLAMQELAKGLSLAEVSDKYNQNTYSKGLKGIIKNIRLNTNIPGIGNDAALEELIRNAEVNPATFAGPVKTDTGWHIFRVTESIPGRQKTYEEVKSELEQRYRPTKERQMLDEMIANLKTKYNVTVDTALTAKIDMKVRVNNDSLYTLPVIDSPNPALKITVAQLLATYDKIPPQEQLMITKGGGAQQLVEQELMQNLIHVEALAGNYGQYITENADLKAAKRSFILRKAYEQLVVNNVSVTKDEIAARYQKDIEQYANPAYRSIEALFFENKKIANKAWRQYNSAKKGKNEKKMQSIIKKYSLQPANAILDYQYNNGIVTGVGPDADFSKMIWSNPVGYLSPVFTSAKGNLVFFRILNESPKTYKPLTDNESKIEAVLKKEKEKTKQDEVTEQLFVELNMRKYPEKFSSLLTAEELFTQADDSARQRNFKDAINFYDQIIKSYKNGTDDYKASFMKAFLIAEEMKNTEQALQLFKDFLKTYPTGDLNESARFMIDTLEGNTPEVLEDIQD